ncbi:uncharacterized protein K452DRAFT_290924 [Aplosporella prunicola CBS 121167]|uniref:Uncharacterized protein n=1 Tax=Aplosporella prunicola CBS 121167 TaxID=1176127 RepID=A0A6A6B5T8_9PEZI|nr:uncharacterized protein K452DRAFT_290924 [Aplosporella prunicola CBS 121167]KAF2138337.1 hypothetical protein K452DRAFT_290924 [Aplosporella prunicola CBS 121167]
MACRCVCLRLRRWHCGWLCVPYLSICRRRAHGAWLSISISSSPLPSFFFIGTYACVRPHSQQVKSSPSKQHNVLKVTINKYTSYKYRGYG